MSALAYILVIFSEAFSPVGRVLGLVVLVLLSLPG